VRFNCLILASLAFIPCANAQDARSAFAGTPAFPSASALHQHAMPPHFPSSVEIHKAAHKSHEKLSRFHPDSTPVQSFPKALPQPSGHVDFNEVIRKSGQLNHALAHPRNPSPDLLVFVSFSMPRESMKRLAAQAGIAHAAIILRGLVKDTKGKPSFHATGIEVGKLKLENGQGFSVDPMAFRKYAINQVPAFVLLTQKDCATCGKDFIPKHIKLAGDVSLDYALRAMQRRRPKVSPRVKPYLAALKHGFFAGKRK